MSRKKSIFVLFVLFALLLMSCDAANDSSNTPDIVGLWYITDNPDALTPHQYIRIEKESYEILDTNQDVFESGPITSLTSTDYEYTIQRQDYHSDYIGSQSYAAYSITENTLDISYYDSSIMGTRYCTFKAIRQ